MASNSTVLMHLEDIKFREDLYPRIKKDAALVQQYAATLDVLPPVEVNQHNELIDGWHRWTAHKKNEVKDITVIVTETASDMAFLSLAIRRNSAFGKQLTDGDKKSMAIRLYHAGEGLEKPEIAETLSITLQWLNRMLSDVDKTLREQRKQRIFDMWLACYTSEEIAEAIDEPRRTIADEVKVLADLNLVSNSPKVHAKHMDEAFEVPIYNVWAWGKKTNTVGHFGNSEQRIVDNLLYLHTEPFDIVVDPFGGGGSTIDVCKKRLRRYWVADRKPIVEREDDIRKHDCVADGPPPLHKRWADVSLTYLDPPYWKQAEGKYSKDAEDLANMDLDTFTESLAKLINAIAKKQSKGVIALLMQPTQWNAPERKFTDHVLDIAKRVKLPLANRVQCPYSTEQCNPQMVTWAKDNRELLVLSRELLVWRLDG